MLFQEASETGEVIGADAFGVTKQRVGQGGIFGGTRLGSHRHQRFRENPRAEKLLGRRLSRKLKRRFRRLDRRDGTVHRRWDRGRICARGRSRT